MTRIFFINQGCRRAAVGYYGFGYFVHIETDGWINKAADKVANKGNACNFRTATVRLPNAGRNLKWEQAAKLKQWGS